MRSQLPYQVKAALVDAALSLRNVDHDTNAGLSYAATLNEFAQFGDPTFDKRDVLRRYARVLSGSAFACAQAGDVLHQWRTVNGHEGLLNQVVAPLAVELERRLN